MKIRCTTRFDITATGVTGHFKPSRIPFVDKSGQQITDESSWNHARNQQRNWETITQLISLRTQVNSLSWPVCVDHTWEFDFEVDSDEIFWLDDDPLGVLKKDCDAVPILLSHDDSLNNNNIWFELINI